MKFAIITIGIAISAISLINMIFFHEFQISEITFIIGIIIAGIAYTQIPENQKPAINVNAVNKNIQTLNDILWGKREKESAIKLTQEQYWQITTQDKCRDLQDIRGISYCWYGSRRGYCTYEQCPRRIK